MSYLPLFPIIADNNVVTEGISYRTGITEAWGGTEQRIKLREEPLLRTTFSFTLLERDKALLDSVMHGAIHNSTKQFTVPIWQDLEATTVKISAASTKALTPEPTAGYDYHNGGLLVVIADIVNLDYDHKRAVMPHQYEIQLIDTVNANDIDIDAVGGFDLSWAVGSYLLPARVGWIEGSEIVCVDPNAQAKVYRASVTFRFKVVA